MVISNDVSVEHNIILILLQGIRVQKVTENTLDKELQQDTEIFVYIHPAADLPSNDQTPSLYFTSYAMRNRISLCATH
jgi:hypothetical protein